MKKTDFSKEKIKKDGEMLIKTVYNEDNIKNKTLMNYHHKIKDINTNNDEVVMASVFDDLNKDERQNIHEEEMTFRSKKHYLQTENLFK